MDRVKYFKDDPNNGWKLHLSFNTNNKADAEIVSLFLSYLKKWYGVQYKIGRSGQMGKDATVYCGSKKNAQYIANLIKEEIGHHLQTPYGEDILSDDIFFNDKVAGRFATIVDGFHQYGGKGIPYLKKDMGKVVWHEDDWDKDKWRESSYNTSDKLLREKFGEYYTGRKKKVLNRKVKRCVCKKVG